VSLVIFLKKEDGSIDPKKAVVDLVGKCFKDQCASKEWQEKF